MSPRPIWQRTLDHLPKAAVVLALGVVAFWVLRNPVERFQPRVPGTDKAPGGAEGGKGNPVLAGKVTPGPGQASKISAGWPGFRNDGSGAVRGGAPLAKAWESGGPKELWGVDVGEGYGGPAVAQGRVYLMDYDKEHKQDALRCLSLDDGREIWRFSYPMSVKRNHGMTRTIPTVAQNLVVAMGPKCHVICADAATGELKWGLDLVQDFGTTVPQWYAGQCPLVEGDRVILAPGGPAAQLMAVQLADGQVLWRTPNPHDWKMTHVSVVPLDFAGRHQYVYCGSQGVVGVDAKDGSILWETTDWKISIATVPSPVVLEGGRIFFSGGYNAGSLFLQLKEEGGRIVPKSERRLEASIFGATQHTPILHDGYLYGTRADGRFVCLGLDGKVVWSSDASTNFGLGPFLLADGRFYVMNDSGRLTVIEASPAKCTTLGSAQVLQGHESWGPLAVVGNRLLARDFTRLICLDMTAR